MEEGYVIMRKITAVLCIILIYISCLDVSYAKARKMYDDIEFAGEEVDEMQHLLFAKLAYDYLDGYEGNTVEEYVKVKPDLYSGEIWIDSGITYEALYCSLVGDWDIYKVFNRNSQSGFYAVAFKKDKQVVLAYRGSDMVTEEFPLDECNDWTGTDFKFSILNKLSGQFDDADNSLKRLKELLIKDGLKDDSVEITLTGHSLGGALTAYEALVSGCYGYSFDGACGHVIDLIYYYNYLDIDGFEGISGENKICSTFCNYTDEPGYVIADLIQHTNHNAMYQIDRKTNLDGLNENTLIPRLTDAGSHIIWSCVDYEDNCVFFTDKLESGSSEYTYVPDDTVCLDIYKNVLERMYEDASWLCFDYKEMLGALTGVIKDGRVILAGSDGDVLCAYDKIGVSSMFDVDTVMYGGKGSDVLYGYVADDVLIAGYGEAEGTTNILDGNLGNDVYIIDNNPGTETKINDIGGNTSSIIFRNMNINRISMLDYDGKGTLAIPELNQNINLKMAQDRENIMLFSYQDKKLIQLGSLADLSGKNEPDTVQDEQYVVVLEGRGSIRIAVDDEETVINNDISGYVSGSDDYGYYYVCGDEDRESILLILDELYDIRVSNENERVDLAIGKYNADKGMTACERKYNRRFDDYKIYFTESSLDDGVQGNAGLQDAIYAEIDILQGILNHSR